jgi:hypothetical protein
MMHRNINIPTAYASALTVPHDLGGGVFFVACSKTTTIKG